MREGGTCGAGWNDLTLYEHKASEFWLWVNSWAVCIQRPSDLGFSDEGFDLPPLDVRWHSVATDITDAGEDSRGQRKLIREAALGVVTAAREKRATLADRIAKTAEIVNGSQDDHFIIWHDLEDERRALEKALPEIETVFGTQPYDRREFFVDRFAEGDSRLIGAKPVMLGGGVNLQRHCHRAIFAGVGFKFRDFIQAIHRVQRFGQTQPVIIDVIHADTEQEVVRELQAKWQRHDEMQARMADITHTPQEYSLARWQVDAHSFWRSAGDRPLTPYELASNADRFAAMPVGPLVKQFTTESREMIYDFAAHVAIGEQIDQRGPNDERGSLPRTFMSLAPGSHHPDVWDDVVRMTPAFLPRLMHYTTLSHRPRQPEDGMCVEFANALRAATLDGSLGAVWLHPAQELCFGHKTGIRAAVSRAMGMHVGVADYLFMWANGACALEAKFGKGRMTENQSDFAAWCEANGVPHRVFRSVDEGLSLLEGFGVLG